MDSNFPTEEEIKEKGIWNAKQSNLRQDVWDYGEYRLVISDCGYFRKIIQKCID